MKRLNKQDVWEGAIIILGAITLAGTLMALAGCQGDSSPKSEASTSDSYKFTITNTIQDQHVHNYPVEYRPGQFFVLPKLVVVPVTAPAEQCP